VQENNLDKSRRSKNWWPRKKEDFGALQNWICFRNFFPSCYNFRILVFLYLHSQRMPKKSW